jgi:hypothetical protein
MIPYAHQVEALARIERRPRHPSGEDVFALLCDMGTGKTKIVLDDYARGNLTDLLVVAPAGSYRNWFVDRGADNPSELRKHLPEELFNKLSICGWRSGPGKRKLAEIDEFLNETGSPRVLVINDDAIETCKTFLSAGMAMMVVDESTKIKNHKAKRTKTIMELGRLAMARRIMSGLPTPRSPLDLYSQFDFLDWNILGHRSFWTFKMRYAVLKKIRFGGRSVEVIVGYRNVDELNSIIDPYSFRVMKEDCLDLPKKIYQRRDVELSAEQRRIYDSLIRSATAQIGAEEFVTATTVMTQILRLHQVASGFSRDDDSGRLVEIDNNRLGILMDVLEDHSGKAIVWAPYDASIRKISGAIASEYGEVSVARFWGGNLSTRGDDESRFLGDSNCRFMVSTPAAGGIGNNWTVADLVVYYANNYDLEQRSQSEDRCHRSGQTKPVTYVDIVAAGTVDEKILETLRKKIDMASSITGDNYREWLI